jgi:gliding motility-associated-like protein
MKNTLLVFLLLFAAIRGYCQCTLSVNLTSSGPSICSGSSVVLTATASAGTAPFTYAWSTGQSTASISVNKPGTYTVTVSDKTAGCQPVKQSITITSGVAPAAPTAANAVACPNSPVTLTATAPGGTYQWYDASTGGNFLATGASYTTPPITAPTIFYVQTTLNGCPSPRTPVVVSIQSKPLIGNTTICSGDVATLAASGGASYAWYDNSGATGPILGTGPQFVTPPLTATTIYYVVVTSASGCVSAPTAVTAFVTAAPAAPTASGTTVCGGNSVTLHATGSGTLDWFTAPTGGTSLISSPDFTTPVLTTTTTYYVQSTVNTCSGPRTPVTVTVTPQPTAPVVADVTICSGTAATLTPTGPGGPYEWFNTPSGGTILFTGPTFTTPVLTSSATYYVRVNNGCLSQRTAVNVIVTPPPSLPSVAGAVICSGNTATLTATAPGGVYQWYDAPTNGNLLFTGPSFTTPALSVNTTYYVQAIVAGCVSGRTPVTVSIMPPPASPTVPATSICPGNTATLSVTSPSGDYAWYDAASGGNLLSAGPIYTTPVLNSTTTYYVELINSTGCPSVRTPVTVTVNAPPGPPTASGTTVCPGSNATLTATGTGTISWYDAATGGNLLFTGASYVTPALGATTTYYAEQTTTCPSARTAVIVTVSPVANPQFKYASGTFCASGTNATPVLNNPAGGVFSASPAGLVFVSTTTGEINVAASAPGTYTVTYAGAGTCPFSTSSPVTITTSPNAQFSYAATGYCQNQTVALPAFPAGASAGVFSAPAGIFFSNTSTGQINPSKSAPGTYTITNTIAASGSCPAATFNASVTIYQPVTVVAGPNQTVATGTPVNLSGSVTGGATTGTWSGGTGSFSNPNALNSVYTPGPGETTATLTLTSGDPAGPCGAATSKLTITFSPLPTGPTAAGTTVCSGDVAQLTAVAPGGIYKWYDAATGGNLLYTGQTFVTPPITANTTYYVQTTIAGATSTRTPVAVTLNAAPAAPVASGTSTCSGNTATLTASGSPGGYGWYDAPTGGNLLSTSNTYTTTFLTAPVSYYVASVVNGCQSARVKVDVTVTPVPSVTSASTGDVCSGVAQAYAITSNVTGTTFTWSRAAVAGVSNPAVVSQAGSSITETLVNTTNAPVTVTYIITPTAGSCAGTPYNYVVTVNPAPTVSSGSAVTVCSGKPIGYNITFSSPAAVTFTWSRAVVAGISNSAIAGQASATIQESLFNTTSAPIDVTYVITYQTASCTGLTFNLTVTVSPSATITSKASGSACTGVPLDYQITSDVTGATFTWNRLAAVGVSNPAISNQTANPIAETLINTTPSPVNVAYDITPVVGGCPGTPFRYTVTVNPTVPTPVANTNSPVCAGTSINLQSPTIPNAVYNWSGPNGFTSVQQNPVISNASAANAGTYTLFITINGCASPSVTATVQVDPPPVANAGPDQTVCTGTAFVQLAGSVSGGTTSGLWTTSGTGIFPAGAAVLNGTYSPSAADQSAGQVTLTLTSTSPDNCTVATAPMTITFSSPSVTSKATDGVCSGTALNYTITSDFPAATFSWSRAAVAGISNGAVSGQTTSTITETLINSTASPIQVPYTITPLSAGCPGTPFTYTVTVNPIPAKPTITSNSPVCVGSTLTLQTPTVAGATYAWVGPNGFTSAAQNPTISNVTAADAGGYSVTLTVAGCTGPTSVNVNVLVDPQSTADAGPDQTVCPATTTITLSGTITGGPATGKWTTTGTGTIASATSLQTTYTASAQDISAGSVTFTLATVSNDNCSISTSQMTVKFQLLKAVTAGPDQSVCSQSGVKLDGQISIAGGGVWTSSGTGTFIPSASQLDAIYYPSSDDITTGFVSLTLTANNAGTCYIPSDQLTVTLVPPPTVSFDGPVYVLKGQTVTLTPKVSDPSVSYAWSPDIDISSTTAADPVITGSVDRTYTVNVIDSRGCVSSAKVNVIVSPLITIPNTFTPNGDGVNDLWNIQGLTAYTHATVDIYDRNGQKVFHSIGYGIPWDGTAGGKQVPYGVYYYIIDPKFEGLHVLSGYVTVVR